MTTLPVAFADNGAVVFGPTKCRMRDCHTITSGAAYVGGYMSLPMCPEHLDLSSVLAVLMERGVVVDLTV